MSLPVGAPSAVAAGAGLATVGCFSAGVAAAAWVLRSLVAWPVDAWMLRRASGLDIKTQNRGLPSIALVAGAMAARLFSAQTWVSLGCGLLLLMCARGR